MRENKVAQNNRKGQTGFAVSIIMIANFAVKFFGLLREVLTAKYYGTSYYTDAYIIANNIPTTLFSAVGAAIATTFIPMYTNIYNEDSEKKANTFSLHVIEIVLFICLIITLLGECFSKQIVLIFASGFKGETLNITIRFVTILFPSVFALALFDLLGSYLQQHEKFAALAIVPIISNIVIILALIVSHALENIFILVWGTLIGIAAQVIFYIPWAVRCGLFTGSWRGLAGDSYIHKLLILVLPVFIGEAVNEINSLVDKSLVSSLETGSVAALNYAYKIINLMTGIIAASILTVQYPRLASAAADNKGNEFRSKGQNTFLAMLAILLPLSIAIIIYRVEIIQILFERGSFDSISVSRTALALKYYTIGLAAIGTREVLIRLFYCLQDTKTPMINGIICACINIVLDLISIPAWGVKGAALSTSVAAIFGMMILLGILNKRKIVYLNQLISSMIKSCFASILFASVLLLVRNILRTSFGFSIIYITLSIVAICFCLLLYLGMQIIFKNPIVKSIWNVIQRK